MEKKRNNKKLFAIIGGSVLAFVLTIALSVSITLAYFGGTANGTQTITMDKAVTVGLNNLGSANVVNALPGQKVEVNATATVTSGESGAFVAMKVTATAAEGATITAPTLTVSGDWVKVGDYYFYATGAADNTAKLTKVANAGTAVLAGSFVLDKTLTNAVAEDVISVRVDVIAVQGVAFDSNGAKITDPTIAQALEMFDQFDNTIVA